MKDIGFDIDEVVEIDDGSFSCIPEFAKIIRKDDSFFRKGYKVLPSEGFIVDKYGKIKEIRFNEDEETKILRERYVPRKQVRKLWKEYSGVKIN